MVMRFRDRAHAGQLLGDLVAERVTAHASTVPLVLALPRGGVPVAVPVAAAVAGELEVFVARKLEAPGNPEYGIGAVAEGTDEVVLAAAADRSGYDEAALAAVAGRERQEVTRRVERYRQGRPLPSPAGRLVVVVDDGLATGVTAEAALRALRAMAPSRLLLAVPVGAPDTATRLRGIADEVLCLLEPGGFRAVGSFYDSFAPTTDAEVLRLLGRPPA